RRESNGRCPFRRRIAHGCVVARLRKRECESPARSGVLATSKTRARYFPCLRANLRFSVERSKAIRLFSWMTTFHGPNPGLHLSLQSLWRVVPPQNRKKPLAEF